MKKFLLSLLLVLMGAMWSSVDARWIIGDRKNATQIQPGDTVVLEHSSRTADLGYYLQAVTTAKGVELREGLGVGDAAVVTFEEGPVDVRTGAPTVYIKLVNNGKYIGQSTSWDNGCGLATDPAKAANFQVISCSEDIPWSNTYGWEDFQEGVFRDDATYTEKTVANWRVNSAGRGSDENSVGFAWSKSETDFAYLGFWGTKAPNILLWSYTDTNQWNVYAVTYEKSLQDDLQDVIDTYTGDGKEFTAGTDPGYYDEAASDAYDEALQEALIISMDGSLSDEEYQAAIDNLISARAAVENAMIPLSEGYYFLVSGFDDFLNNFGVEKAAYIDPNVPNLKYRTFDAENVDFVFYITPNGETDEFLVQSYANGYYVAKGTAWYNSNPACTEDPEEPQNMRLYVPGKWYWGSHTYHNTSYTPYASSQPKATDGQGNLTSWGQWKDDSTVQTHFNLWYVRKISDEQMEGFAEKKAQSDRDAELKALVADANKLYDKLFAYEPDYSAKLITTVSGGADEEPGEGNQITFSTIRRQGVKFADKYEFLIDDDDTTYMQGSGYMSIKLKEPKQVITMVYNTRDASGHGSNANWHVWGANERPKLVSLYGANTEAGDTVYGGALATGIDMGSLPLPATYTFDFGRPVNRIAYQVTQNANGGSYFTISEFQMYEAKANETKSQYFSVEGMKDKADAMKALAIAKNAVADSSETTNEDIAELQAAIAAVNELYADTTKLVELANKAQALADNTEVGDAVGQQSDENAADALIEAIVAAKALGLKEDATKADLDTALADLQAAIDAFMSTFNSFEEGKWYFIINSDLRDASTVAGKALYMSGCNNDPAKVGKVVDGNPEYTYDPYCMWRFVATDTEGQFAVQNMGTGFYLSAGTGRAADVLQSYEPVPYAVDFIGGNSFTFVPQQGNSHGFAVVGNAGKAVFTDPTGEVDSTAWQLFEIDPEETQFITVKDFKLNALDIFALPYNVSLLAELNEDNDCHIYGIKKMTYDEETDETTIDFYEVDELAANESALFVFGNLENEYENFELLLPFPTEVVDKLTPTNGIYGMLHTEKIEENIAFGSGKDLVLAGEGGTSISAHTGAIDPKYYKGEVEGVETAMTITVKGLKWPDATAGDVDGDGNVNTSDVVAVYNFIIDGTGVTKEAADVNGDGDVNSTDVVAIYNLIIYGNINGQSAGSKSFYPEADGDDTEVTVLVGSTDNLAEIPVTVYLTNPTVDITAVEANLEAPVSVDKFVYDDEEEDYKTADTDRWGKKHTVKYAAGTAAHGANVFFISITNPDNKAFKEKEGAVVTVYFDGSELADGDYVVKMTSSLAVGTDAKSYKAADMDAKFSIKDGKVTAVAALTAEAVAAGKAVYTVDGKKVAAPAKGQIYVVEGKAVKF